MTVTTTKLQSRLLLGLILISPSILAAQAHKSPNLLDLTGAPNGWLIVNDTVMGGVSQSSIQAEEDKTLVFKGELSLKNNGGFVSTRSRTSPLNFNNATAVDLRIKGDGRTYYLDLRQSRTMRAGSFRAPFTTTPGKWENIRIPLSNFVFQSFGRPFPNAVLPRGAISSIGITLSDKKPGDFILEIQSIVTVQTDPNSVPETAQTASQTDTPLRLIEDAISNGVPLFNSGDPSACAAIYEAACRALLRMPETPVNAQTSLDAALTDSQSAQDPTQKAWILRYALDDTWKQLLSRGQ